MGRGGIGKCGDGSVVEETAALTEVVLLRLGAGPDFRMAVGLIETLDKIEHSTVRG